jgi:hypothetical protein
VGTDLGLDDELAEVLGISGTEIPLKACNPGYVSATTDQQFVAALIKLKERLLQGDQANLLSSSAIALSRRIPTVIEVAKARPRPIFNRNEDRLANELISMENYGIAQKALEGKTTVGLKFLAPFADPAKRAIGLIATSGEIQGTLFTSSDYNLGTAIRYNEHTYVISPDVKGHGRNNLLIIL